MRRRCLRGARDPAHFDRLPDQRERRAAPPPLERDQPVHADFPAGRHIEWSRRRIGRRVQQPFLSRLRLNDRRVGRRTTTLLGERIDVLIRPGLQIFDPCEAAGIGIYAMALIPNPPLDRAFGLRPARRTSTAPAAIRRA